MGKHETGYARIERDDYPTPPWVVTDALAEHIDLRGLNVWEFACGKEGRMARALRTAGCARVYATDIGNGYADQDEMLNFLSGRTPDLPHFDAGITNPPFGPRGKTAEAFIARGLELLASGYIDLLALLLPHDFDSAKTRAHLFRDCPHFTGKITLLQRVKWFEHPDPDQRTRNPKENTDWCFWSRPVSHVRRQPIILYSPNPQPNRRR
jgi:hypothetical protein